MKKQNPPNLRLIKKTIQKLTDAKLTQAAGGVKLCDSDSEMVPE
jgi:hypothetical protein